MSDALPRDESDDGSRQGARAQFIWCIQALACSPADQLSLFPDFVCKADELALDFDHWFGVAQSWFGDEITDDQFAALKAIDSRLDAMSNGGAEFTEDLWYEGALSTRQEWADVRSLAKSALACFGWPVQKPPYGRSLYVNGTHDPE